MAEGVHRPNSGRFLVVTWDGGGNVHPAIGLGHLLVRRGHAVRMLGQRTLQRRIENAGCAFRPLPVSLEWDASHGRAWEDQGQREYARDLFARTPVAEAVLAEVDREPTDVLLVDCYLRNALSAAERTSLPTAGLLHVRYRFLAEIPNQNWLWDFDPVNELRQQLGLESVSKGSERLPALLSRRCDRILAVIPREFEDFNGPLPPNLRYVGPVLEGDEEGSTWDLPWPQDHPDPLIVVSFSTTYMHHEALMAHILTALEDLPVRTLVLLGGGLEPHELTAPPGVVIRRYLPHAAVLPQTALVITHAGMGTVMAAFAYGVPVLCLPLGRDQVGNAEVVEARGAGRRIAPDASVQELRAAIVDVLGSESLRTGARRMAEIVAGYGRGGVAISELESMLALSRTRVSS